MTELKTHLFVGIKFWPPEALLPREDVERSTRCEREGHEVAVRHEELADLEDDFLRQEVQRHFDSFQKATI